MEERLLLMYALADLGLKARQSAAITKNPASEKVKRYSSTLIGCVPSIKWAKTPIEPISRHPKISVESPFVLPIAYSGKLKKPSSTSLVGTTFICAML